MTAVNLPAENNHAILLGVGARYVVETTFSIGRSAGSSLTLDTPDASREHAEIRRGEDSAFILQDLGSKNGTYLNGRRILKPASLEDGDEIFVAGTTLRFLPPGPATSFGKSPAKRQRAQRLTLEGERLRIGRSPANEIVLDDPNVSRLHAELCEIDGGVRIRDLGSRNGTYVDGHPVEDEPLRTGALIRIGSSRLIFDGRRVVARDERELLHLVANQIGFAVEGKEILQPTSLAIAPGELVAIVGESGSGKTTLIRMLAGVSRPSRGTVTIGGEAIVGRTTDVAYVPQHEIVHTSLSVEEAYSYAARLRLPDDTDGQERAVRINRTLDELSLQEHRATRIGNLSGGQRRRVGIGIELLARPSLVCLDEPTTGLDPMLEARAMAVFRGLAEGTRSVVLVTHSTQSLHLCDKLVVLGRDGLLAFCGSPTETVKFFGADSLHDLYRALASKPAADWNERYEAGRDTPAIPTSQGAANAPTPRPRVSALRQGLILLSRYWRTFGRDRRNLAILFGQVPLISLALLALFRGNVFSPDYETPSDAAFMLFLLVTMASWFGLLDATREVIKERSVFLREQAVGLRVSAYLGSKLALLLGVATVQIGLLSAIVFLFRPLHESAAVYAGVVAALLLTGLAAVGLGLLTSALVSSENQAPSAVPILLVPQLFFAGAIVPLVKMSDLVADLANLVFAKWSFALLGTLVDMNQRIASNPKAAKSSNYGTEFFDASVPLSFAVLGAFTLAFALFAALRLSRSAGS